MAYLEKFIGKDAETVANAWVVIQAIQDWQNDEDTDDISRAFELLGAVRRWLEVANEKPRTKLLGDDPTRIEVYVTSALRVARLCEYVQGQNGRATVHINAGAYKVVLAGGAPEEVRQVFRRIAAEA